MVMPANGLADVVPQNLNDETRRRGALIVLEGLDRSGKSTQAQLLLECLQKSGQNAKIQRFPARSEPITGPAIDNFLKTSKNVQEDREAFHLLFSANRWLTAPSMVRELDNGIHLILDRYSFSGIAYSLAKGLDKNWVCQPEVGLPRPDIVIFLDIKPDEAGKRDGFGGEVMEQREFQKAVYSQMENIYNPGYWTRVNASSPVQDVHEEIKERVLGAIKYLEEENYPAKKMTLEDFKF